MSGRSFSKTELLACAALALLATTSACKHDAPSTPTTPLKVAGAADLARAFKDVGDTYQKKTGQPVTFSFGSTGLLAKQIEEGAPFDVFAAADISYADDVVKSGACFGDSKTLYATGRIVMWSRKGAPLPQTLEDLAGADITKIAIANPDHAPYGRAAKQALTKAGVWDRVSPRLVYGDNVQQTLQFAQSGNVDVAIVALSLAIGSEGQFTAIDASLHDRLDQALVVCKGGAAGGSNDGAKRFTAFVDSPEGRTIMRQYGFLLPGETTLATSAPKPE